MTPIYGSMYVTCFGSAYFETDFPVPSSDCLNVWVDNYRNTMKSWRKQQLRKVTKRLSGSDITLQERWAVSKSHNDFIDNNSSQDSKRCCKGDRMESRKL